MSWEIKYFVHEASRSRLLKENKERDERMQGGVCWYEEKAGRESI